MTTGKEAELERTTRLRGFRYGLHDFLAELDLNALKTVNDHVEANYVNESLLDRKTKEQWCKGGAILCTIGLLQFCHQGGRYAR